MPAMPLLSAAALLAHLRFAPLERTRTLSTRVSSLLPLSMFMDLAVLAGHLILYPTGISQEQPAPRHAPRRAGQDTDADAPAVLPTEGRAHPPVLMLHGFIDNRSVFVLLRRSLRRHGWRHVEALNYSPLTCDLRKAADLLGKHVEEVCLRTGHTRVDIVGHSLGGLIARYYVQRLGGDSRVRTVITLGTPHSGTSVAPLMSAHPVIRQMRPDSDVIAELALPAPHCRTHFVAFWSEDDHVMAPPRTACVEHPDLSAYNVHVTGVGHLALPVNGTVAAGIREALTSVEEAEGTGRAFSVA